MRQLLSPFVDVQDKFGLNHVAERDDTFLNQAYWPSRVCHVRIQLSLGTFCARQISNLYNKAKPLIITTPRKSYRFSPTSHDTVCLDSYAAPELFSDDAQGVCSDQAHSPQLSVAGNTSLPAWGNNALREPHLMAISAASATTYELLQQAKAIHLCGKYPPFAIS